MALRQYPMESLVVDGAFWRGRRVLLTGHTGFKGSWLALWLQRLGAEVTGFALAPTEPSLFELADVARDMHDVRGDIRDLDAVRAAVDHADAQVIIHMAAQSLVRRSNREPLDTFAINAMGSANLLEAARTAPSARAIVVVTSDKCYADGDARVPHREDDRLGGNDAYSASKACAELVVGAYRHSFLGERLALATVRAGNVIGGGDWADDRLVPDAIRAFAAHQPLEVRNAAATRPWQHVLEPTSAYLALGERLCSAGKEFAQAWNIGPDDSHSVGEVATRIAKLWGDGASWQACAAAHPPEAAALALDSSKARRELGWTPRTSIDEALEWTVEWYRGWNEGKDARRMTESQIDLFSARRA